MPLRLTDAIQKIFPSARTGSKDLDDILRAEFSGEMSQDKLLASLRYRSYFSDDFLAAGIDTRFSSTAGSGTANAAATTVANALNGEITIKSASNNGTHAANGATLTLDDLGYKANQGGVVLEVRAKFDSLTSLWAFIGFTDTISTTVEYPIGITTVTPNSDATDAIGFLYDAAATATKVHLGAVANDVDATAVNTGVLPVADTYLTFRLEVDAAGGCQGFVNGNLVGSLPSASVRPTIALTPAVFVGNTAAAQRTLTVDYFAVAQNR
jgi:hypothetical protein